MMRIALLIGLLSVCWFIELRGQVPGNVPHIEPGLWFDYHEFNSLTEPDSARQLGQRVPLRSGAVAALDAAGYNTIRGTRTENFGIVYRAYLYLDVSGDWRFRHQNPDFQLQLVLGDRVLLTSTWPTASADTTINLPAGWYLMQVYFFNETGQHNFGSLTWQPPNAAVFSAIPAGDAAGTTRGYYRPTMPMWLSGDGAVNGTGNRATDWLDRTGWNSLTSPNFNRPDYVTNPTDATFNFNPYLRFNPGTRDLDYIGKNHFTGFGTDAVNQFMVVRRENTTQREALVSYATPSFNNEWLVLNPATLNLLVKEDFLATGGNLLGQNLTHNITTQNTPKILTFVHRNIGSASGNNGRSAMNGTNTGGWRYQHNVSVQNGGYLMFGQEQDNVGGGFEADQAFYGEIAEVIHYNRNLSDAEQQRVQTYLAIKYGITLGHNYLDGAGNVIWSRNDASSNYNNAITAVGKDFSSYLSQSRSTSVEPNGVLTLEATPAFSPVTDADGNQRRYVLMGKNSANLSGNATSGGSPSDGFTRNNAPSDLRRSAAMWYTRVHNQGTRTYTLEFDVSNFTAPERAFTYVLLQRVGSTDFRSNTTRTSGIIVGNVLRFTNVSLANNQYVAIGRFEAAPVLTFENQNPNAPAGSWEACVGDMVRFTYNGLDGQPNELVLRTTSNLDTVITVSPTAGTGPTQNGVITLMFPPNMATSRVTLRRNGTELMTSSEFLIVHNPQLEIIVDKPVLCATDREIRVRGFPSNVVPGSGFTSAPNVSRDSIGFAWIDPARLPFSPNTNDGQDVLQLTYAYQPVYLGTTAACGQPLIRTLPFIVMDNRLVSFPFRRIISATSPIAPNAFNFLDTSVIDIGGIFPALATSATDTAAIINRINSSISFSGTFVEPVAGTAPDKFLSGAADFGSHTIQVTFRNGGCSTTISSPIEVAPPIKIPGLAEERCRFAGPLPFSRDTAYQQATNTDTVRNSAGEIVYTRTTTRNILLGVTTLNPAHAGSINQTGFTFNDERFQFRPNPAVPSTDTLVVVSMNFRTTTNTIFFDADPASPNYRQPTGNSSTSNTFSARQPVVIRERPIVRVDNTLTPPNQPYCMDAAPKVLRSTPAFLSSTASRYRLIDRFSLVSVTLPQDTVLDFFTLYNNQDPSRSRDVTFDIVYIIDTLGCVDTDTAAFRILAPDRPAFIGRNAPTNIYCLNDAEDLLTLSPAINNQPRTSITGPGMGLFNTGATSSSRRMFSPRQAGVGSHPIHYVYENVFGCVSDYWDTLTVRPAAQAELVTTDGRSEYCANIDTVILRVNVISGAGIGNISFSGVAVIDSIFSPSQVFNGGFGTTRVFAEYTDTFNCRALDTLVIAVRPIPTVDFAIAPSFCRNAPIERINFTPHPTTGRGGIVTARGTFGQDTATFFNPAQVTSPFVTAFDTITYRYTNQFGCVNQIARIVRVDSIPNISIFGLDPAYCINSPQDTLSATPNAATSLGTGSFAGPGVNPNTGLFTPSLAGTGIKFISYTFTDGRGCTNIKIDTTVINGLPDASFTGLNPEYCIDAPIDTLRGLAQGGTGYFTGRAIIDSVAGLLRPSNDSAGLRTVSYVYTDTLGCTNTSTQSFFIHALPVVSVEGLDDAYCKNAEDQRVIGIPVGGVLSTNRGNSGLQIIAPGVGFFAPRQADTGVHNFTYQFTSVNGCRGTASFQTRVFPAVNPVILDLPATYCEVRDTLPLRGVPSGGRFFGIGMLSGTSNFLPALAGGGVHGIEYVVNDTFTRQNGTQLVCSNRATQQITVYALPVPRILSPIDNSTFCSTDTLSRPLLDAVNSGVIASSYFRGTGVVPRIDTVLDFPTMTFRLDTAYFFNPLAAGPGTHRVTLGIYNQFGCLDSIFHTYTVFQTPSPTFTQLNPAYCESNPGISLIGSPFGGSFIRNRDTLLVPTYLPNPNFPASLLTGPVFDTIVYSINQNGCANSDTQYVRVNPIPQISFVGETPNNRYCLRLDSIQLTPSVAGGRFTGNGILFGTSLFGPHLAGVGAHVISYEYTEPITNCSNTFRDTLRVFSQPQVKFESFGSCQDQLVALRPDNNLLGMNGIFQGAIFDSITQVRWNLGLGTPDSLVSPRTNRTLDTLRFQYPSPGAYVVNLFVSNQNTCSDSFSLRITIVPRVTSYPYLEDFEAGPGAWQPEDAGQQTGSLWQWGRPTNTQGIDVSSTLSTNNSNVWTTTLAQGYPTNADGWVYSPCFDLSSLNRPMIALDYWSHTENNMDGTVIEYREADGSWQPLGQVNRGINWFNTPIIVGSPGVQSLAPRGWSGRMNNFRNARYMLDEMRYHPDSIHRNFQFRVAFGSSSVTPLDPSDGFAFDNVWIGNRNRNVLLEHFSNVGNPNMNAINQHVYNLCFGTPLIRDVVMMQYHLNQPAADEFYQFNLDNHNARSLFYGADSSGYAIINGNDNSNIPSISLTRQRFEAEMLRTPDFEITIDTFRVLNNTRVQAAARIRALRDMPDSEHYVVQVVLLEDSLNYQQSIGANTINSVVRQMLPDASGTSYIGNWAAGQELPLNTFWNFDPTKHRPQNFSLVVFVQNDVTKEVYQVASSRDIDRFLRLITGQEQPSPELIETWSELRQVKLYPNPAFEHSLLEFDQALTRDYPMQLIDMQGRTLRTAILTQGTQQHRIDIQNLPAGMYYVLIQGPDVIIQRPLVVKRP